MKKRATSIELHKMTAKNQDKNKPMKKKRKQNPGAKPETDRSTSKKPKYLNSKPSKPTLLNSKPLKSPKSISGKPLKALKSQKTGPGDDKKAPLSKRELRIQAKELAEARKKKRKRHYDLEQELAYLWEKMRRRNVAKEDQSRLVSEALQKIKGKIPEIASSHVSSRVLQTCVKYCSQAEKDMVFDELRPHLLTLACNTYAVHLVKKMLDNASKNQLAGVISSFHGHVASLLRHMVGSVVVEHAYQLGNSTQKQELLMELYSTELQLFKSLVAVKESRLVDVISKLNLQKSSVLRHMSSVIQPILEKGIVDHSIIHRLLVEYLSIADQISAADVIQQLSGPLLVRMIHTRDGSRIGMLCVKHGSAKERKKIIKGMKGRIRDIALDQCGCMVLVCLLSIVDDTKLASKIIIHEVQEYLEELVLDKSARRVLLQLLHPNCSRYLSPDDLVSLKLSVPSLCTKGELDNPSECSKVSGLVEDANRDGDMTVGEANVDLNFGTTLEMVEGGKKDPLIRRQELLVKSGLAERFVDVCIQNADKLLVSNFGKEVIYEVASGGADGILHPNMDGKLNDLHESIALLSAKPKTGVSGEEHLIENFHSSRTIRKLILNCPSFATTLWNTALKGKCEMWAEGHSGKVISAFLESSDSKVQELVKYELQPLIDGGKLKNPEKQQVAKEG